jgi:Sulfotransferase domain
MASLTERSIFGAFKKRSPRVFGIGMHKTATTSLAEALGVLGYNTWHWGSAEEAQRIWQEMNANGRSTFVERYDALCDLPITLLYEKLDGAYPNSKFILTIRDENAWVKSAKKHWQRFWDTWESSPFSHEIHQAVYGQIEFDEGIFRERYRRHNEEVMAYFRNRPADLLVMHMDEGAGYGELCRFLKKPIPATSYPNAFVTKLWQPGEALTLLNYIETLREYIEEKRFANKKDSLQTLKSIRAILETASCGKPIDIKEITLRTHTLQAALIKSGLISEYSPDSESDELHMPEWCIAKLLDGITGNFHLGE